MGHCNRALLRIIEEPMPGATFCGLLPPPSPAVLLSEASPNTCGEAFSACVQELGSPSWLYHQAAGVPANSLFFAEPLAHVF